MDAESCYLALNDSFGSIYQEVDLDTLRDHLLSMVQKTMQPAHVSVRLTQPKRRETTRVFLDSSKTRPCG